MNNEENEILWGERVVKMTTFFDNMRCIPEHRQPRRKLPFPLTRNAFEKCRAVP